MPTLVKARPQLAQRPPRRVGSSGSPPFYPTTETKALVKAMAGMKMTQAEIAAVIINPHSLVRSHGRSGGSATPSISQSVVERATKIRPVSHQLVTRRLSHLYRRGEMLAKRHKLMSDWESYCNGRTGSVM
jgi:hypothetical protein